MPDSTTFLPGASQGAAPDVAVIEQPMVAPAPKPGQVLTRRGTVAEEPRSAPNARLGEIVTAANRWRENYNPLRHLTMRRVVELRELAQRGDSAFLQWTYRNIEQSYPTLSALISSCEAPLLTFDWEIKIREQLPVLNSTALAALMADPDLKACVEKKLDQADPRRAEASAKADPEQEQKAFLHAAAERQQRTLRAAYERIDNLKAAIKHLHLAEFRGYAHLQKHRDAQGDVVHLEPLNQWCVCRDGLEGNWFWNPDSRSTSAPLQFLGKDFCIGGPALPLADFIIREVERPIDLIALTNFVRSNLCEKDADAFIEIYGIPGGVVIMPPNVPQGKESEYESAAKNVAEGGSGALPNGSDYKPNDGPRGVDPFTPRLQHLEAQVVLAGTGGKLTMLAESGSGTLAGGAHAETFERIAESRAAKISERFQRDFDGEVINRKHPGEPLLAYFKFGKADEDSRDTVQFKRELLKALAAQPLALCALANQIDLKETIRDAGLALNEDYTIPALSLAEKIP